MFKYIVAENHLGNFPRKVTIQNFSLYMLVELQLLYQQLVESVNPRTSRFLR